MFMKSVIFAVLALTSVSAFAIKDVQKPEYEIQKNAPLVKVPVTEQICKEVGELGAWVSTGITNGMSNTAIGQQVINEGVNNLDNQNLVVAVVMVAPTDIIDAMRDFDQLGAYKEASRIHPEFTRHKLHGAVLQYRCNKMIGTPIEIPKITRVKKVVM